MFYRKNIEDGYIFGVTEGVDEENGNIDEAEYLYIIELIKNTPDAPDGFYYRLKENFEWELCEFHIEENAEATEGDYQKSLESLGVDFNA